MGTFLTGIKSFQNMTEKKLDRTIRKTALDLYKGILESSPVLTSRFRSNNLISIDKDDTSTVEIRTPSTQINEAENKLSEKVAGKTITIQNNLSYALSLEYGRSKQAPSGVYGVTVMRFSHILKTNYNKEKLKG